MRKNKIQMIVMCMIMLAALCFNFTGIKIKAASKSDARIVEYDSDSKTERFHFGRNIGSTVEVTAIGDKESIKITNVNFKTSDSSVCSVRKVEDHFELNFLKEGIAVITMTCRADEELVEKRLLASSLTLISDIEGVLKADSIAYRGCSDKEGISSKDTE